jgi:hypothetical protein
MPETVAVSPGIIEMVNKNQNAIQTASVVVGPSATNELLVTANGIPGWAADGNVNYVDQCWLQARQIGRDPVDNGWHDQFAIQYIGGSAMAGSTTMQVIFKILRLDILYDSSPPPNVGWGQNLQVDIMLLSSQGPAGESAEVPDVLGSDQASAVKDIANAGLQSKVLDLHVPDHGTVAKQSPNPNTVVARGSVVTIWIATGPND